MATITGAVEPMYPPIEPYEQGWLAVGDGHEMYYELSGNPAGAPVLFLHGGPGSSTRPQHRRFFDPAFYRIVLMDQRGCGRSKPYGAIAHNTTHHLVRDVEVLRLKLGVDSWLLFGGSWGSTLALFYAIAHPQRVRGLVLRGVFLASAEELQWFLHGLRAFIPDAWSDFSGGSAENIVGRYLRELDLGGAKASDAARRWSLYEMAAISLGEGASTSNLAGSLDGDVIGRVRVQTHYLANHCFLRPDELLARIDSITHLPAEIVQGTLDMVCPAGTANHVASKLPRSRLTLVHGAGHSATQPALAAQLVAATDRFRDIIE